MLLKLPDVDSVQCTVYVRQQLEMLHTCITRVNWKEEKLPILQKLGDTQNVK